MSSTVDFDDLNEALNYVIGELEAKDQLQYILDVKDPDSFTARTHLGFGMQLRNKLGLWKPHTQSRLVKWFWDNLHVTHADDMSAILMTALWHRVHGQEMSPKQMQEMVERFQAHWFNMISDD